MIDSPTRQPSWDDCMQLLRELPALPLESRATVIEDLIRNPSPGVRERALRVGASVLPDRTLVKYLRDDSDAVLRNAALEILKARNSGSYQLAVDLLRDLSSDVVLQAVLILDHIKDPRAVEPLRGMLHHSEPNVVQAAIIALGHLGDGRTIGDLLPFLEADSWFQMAAIQALGDLRSPQAIGALESLLEDEMVGPMAAEAMAKIGGHDAFASLARHWLARQTELDPETSLGLLAHVLEGLIEPPARIEGLRAALANRLRDPFLGVRVSASRCLLALGVGPEDGEALSLLAAAREEEDFIPGCLSGRSDLVSYLLSKPGRTRSWGLLLAARHPKEIVLEDFAQVLLDRRDPPRLEPVLQVLRVVPRDQLVGPLLEFFLRASREDRSALAEVLSERRAGLEEVAERLEGLTARDRLILSSLVGRPADEIAAKLLDLPEEERLSVAEEFTDNVEIMRLLPWQEWLSENPDIYGDLACRVAVDSRLPELVEPLRSLLASSPSIDIIRAVGELGDRESVPALLDLVATEGLSPILRPMIVENLGRIGGPDARQALRHIASTSDEKLSRLAYRALAACAAEDDCAFFRQAAGHPDWFVRLAVAEVLGRSPEAGNLEALSRLAADPMSIVSRQALAALREEGRPA